MITFINKIALLIINTLVLLKCTYYPQNPNEEEIAKKMWVENDRAVRYTHSVMHISKTPDGGRNSRRIENNKNKYLLIKSINEQRYTPYIYEHIE